MVVLVHRLDQKRARPNRAAKHAVLLRTAQLRAAIRRLSGGTAVERASHLGNLPWAGEERGASRDKRVLDAGEVLESLPCHLAAHPDQGASLSQELHEVDRLGR